MKRSLALLASLMAMGITSTALAQKVGPEFLVNTYTTGFQTSPSVSSDVSGNFIVVWGTPQNENSSGLVGQRFDSNGDRLGGEFQVNTYTTGTQNETSLASDASGNFVVVWQSFGQDGSSYGIFGQRFDSNGDRLGGEFQVNTYTTGTQDETSLASDASGNFIVVWQSFGQDGSSHGIFGQRFDSNGNALGAEFQVNTYTTSSQILPSVASNANGDLVVIWHDATRTEVFGQRYDAGGNRLGGEFQVNTHTGGSQGLTGVASDTSGNFVVVWWSSDGDDIFGQRFGSDGNPLGAEFQVNTYTTGTQITPSVSSDASGNFVVVWWSGHDGGVSGQRYDSAGKRLGGEFEVTTDTLGGSASVSSDASGNFVAVWEGIGAEDDFGIFGQRFAAGCEASVRVEGDVNTAGTIVPVQVHIAHHRLKTVTVRWKLSLLDASEQVIAEHVSPPHTFEPGDVLDQEVKFQLPDDLATGEYTLDLAIKQMAGTKGASTTLRVVRAE